MGISVRAATQHELLAYIRSIQRSGMSTDLLRRPLGITLLAAFFVFGATMCLLTIVLLLVPDSPLAFLWRLNPQARAAFTHMDPWAFVLMTTVGAACGIAAAGLFRGKSWGLWLASCRALDQFDR